MSIWDKNGLHNGTIEATSRQGCALIKQVRHLLRPRILFLLMHFRRVSAPFRLSTVKFSSLPLADFLKTSPNTKCFIYHNMVGRSIAAHRG